MINSEFDTDKGIMLHIGRDDISTVEILSATRLWFSHPEFHPQTPVVWDISGGFLDMTLEDMRNIYSLVRNNVDNKRTGGKTAWVHWSGLVRSMINVVGQEFNWGSQWQTFQDVDEAFNWCKIDNS